MADNTNNIRKFPTGGPVREQNQENRGPMGRRERKPAYIDITLIFCVFVLVVIGLIMIYSTSAYEAGMKNDDVAFFLKKQLFAVSVGVIAMVFTSFYPYKAYMGWSKVALVVSAIAIGLIYTPLAYTANGATRWIKIGPISVQPAEIVKLAIIVFMAYYLCLRTSNVNNVKGMLKALIVPAIFAGAVVICTSNLSSGIIIGAIAFFMVFIKSRDYKTFLLGFGIIFILGAAVVLLAKYEESIGWNILSYRGDRIRAWLDPTAYASDEGYQTLQSLYAIGSGGFWGKGIGESIQKLGFIPEAQNDMIFAIICEELGFAGAIFVLAIFGVLISRIRFIALRVGDLFGSLLAIGVLIHISIQVILNLAVVTNTMPNTGISLPFISYGGTSIVFLMAEMGIVINVGKSIKGE